MAAQTTGCVSCPRLGHVNGIGKRARKQQVPVVVGVGERRTSSAPTDTDRRRQSDDDREPRCDTKIAHSVVTRERGCS